MGVLYPWWELMMTLWWILCRCGHMGRRSRISLLAFLAVLWQSYSVNTSHKSLTYTYLTAWYWCLKHLPTLKLMNCCSYQSNQSRSDLPVTCCSPSSWSAVTLRWLRQERSQEARLRSPLSSLCRQKATKCCMRRTTASLSTFRWVRATEFESYVRHTLWL